MASKVCSVEDACRWCGLEFGRGRLKQLEYSLAEPKHANLNQSKRASHIGSRAETSLSNQTSTSTLEMHCITRKVAKFGKQPFPMIMRIHFHSTSQALFAICIVLSKLWT